MKRRTPLRSKARLRRSSKKRDRENRLRRKVVEKLAEERGTDCQAQVEGVCTGRAMDAHERLTRARGGSITDGRNILLVCRPCHDFITAHPLEAAERGLLRWSWQREDDEGEALPPQEGTA